MPNIRAKKHLGQNFLKNKNILQAIVGTDSLENKNILEIGPGPGDLTAVILEKKPKSFSAIEIDNDMISLLRERFQNHPMHLYHTDVLKIRIEPGKTPKSNTVEVVENNTILIDTYELYGNIPYYITSPILHHFLHEVQVKPEKMTITLQKEVAERILAKNHKHSVLSLSCHLLADIKKVRDINPNNFIPAPKVWSTCLVFTLKKNTKLPHNILTCIKIGFSQKRKKLISSLAKKYGREKCLQAFKKLKIPESIRSEDVSPEDWINLTAEIDS